MNIEMFLKGSNSTNTFFIEKIKSFCFLLIYLFLFFFSKSLTSYNFEVTHTHTPRHTEFLRNTEILLYFQNIIVNHVSKQRKTIFFLDKINDNVKNKRTNQKERKKQKRFISNESNK